MHLSKLVFNHVIQILKAVKLHTYLFIELDKLHSNLKLFDFLERYLKDSEG